VRTCLRGVPGAVLWLALAAPAQGQTAEIVPFYGYRFGGSFFESVTGQEVDVDGAKALGGIVNVPLFDDLQIEALYTHQRADVVIPSAAGADRFPVTVDHWMGGGLRELRGGRARPFLTGLLGLTRYGVPGDQEVRFTVAAGAGAKLLPTRRLGLRVDGRVYGTFADVEGRAIACTPGVCLLALDARVLWQGEFTAGVVVVF
jgi:hypothetical protein